VNFCHGFWI